MGDFNHEADAWDSLRFHDQPYEQVAFAKTCRYCGQGGLWWQARGQMWRLVNADGDMHSCAEYTKKD